MLVMKIIKGIQKPERNIHIFTTLPKTSFSLTLARTSADPVPKNPEQDPDNSSIVTWDWCTRAGETPGAGPNHCHLLGYPLLGQ